MKEKALHEKDVLLDASKHNLQNVRKQCDEMIQEKYDDMKRKREALLENEESLKQKLGEFQNKLEQLASDRDELQQRLLVAEGPSLGVHTAVSGSDVGSAELRAAQVRVYTLQQELSHQRHLRAKAEAGRVIDILSTLPDIRTRRKPRKEIYSVSSQIKEAHEVFANVQQKMASLRVVNVNQRKAVASSNEPSEKNAANEVSDKSKEQLSPRMCLIALQDSLAHLNVRSVRVRNALLPMLASATSQTPNLGVFPGVDHLKRTRETEKSKQIGTISFPSSARIATVTQNRVYLTPDMFRTLHGILA